MNGGIIYGHMTLNQIKEAHDIFINNEQVHIYFFRDVAKERKTGRTEINSISREEFYKYYSRKNGNNQKKDKDDGYVRCVPFENE